MSFISTGLKRRIVEFFLRIPRKGRVRLFLMALIAVGGFKLALTKVHPAPDSSAVMQSDVIDAVSPISCNPERR